MFSRLDTMHVCERETDRRTDGYHVETTELIIKQLALDCSLYGL